MNRIIMSTQKIVEDEQFVHNEHKEWLSQLNFYQDEIKFFQNELVKVIHEHNYSFSSLETVEEYRNILLKKLGQIDEMRHVIMRHERALAFQPEMDSDELKDHKEVGRRFSKFVKKYELLRNNFKRFAAHND